jgi:hypothetical protein
MKSSYRVETRSMVAQARTPVLVGERRLFCRSRFDHGCSYDAVVALGTNEFKEVPRTHRRSVAVRPSLVASSLLRVAVSFS